MALCQGVLEKLAAAGALGDPDGHAADGGGASATTESEDAGDDDVDDDESEVETESDSEAETRGRKRKRGRRGKRGTKPASRRSPRSGSGLAARTSSAGSQKINIYGCTLYAKT